MKRLLSVLLVLTMLGAVSLVSVSADPVTSNKNAEFREKFGLSSNTSDILKAQNEGEKNGSLTTFGIPLTDDEMNKILSQQKLAQEASKIEELQPATYGGRYIDPKTGILYIGLTEDETDTQEKIKNVFTDKEKIKFYKTKYTEKELQTKLDSFNSKLKSMSNDERKNLGFVSVGISPKDNKIRVTVLNNTTTDQIKKITDIIGEEFVIIEIEEQLTKMSRTAKYRPVIAGVKLEKDTFLGNKFCTSGFTAEDNSGNQGVLTAGHCFSLTTDAWQPEVQQFSSTNKLGKPSKWSGNNTNSDATFIPFSDVSPLIYTNDPVKGEVSGSSSLSVGQLLAYEGIMSDLQSGSISCVACTVNTSDGDTFYNQIKATVTVQGGDSGGPAFIVPSYNNLLAAGLVSAGSSSNTTFSAIYHIKTDLGLNKVLTQ